MTVRCSRNTEKVDGYTERRSFKHRARQGRLSCLNGPHMRVLQVAKHVRELRERGPVLILDSGMIHKVMLKTWRGIFRRCDTEVEPGSVRDIV